MPITYRKIAAIQTVKSCRMMIAALITAQGQQGIARDANQRITRGQSFTVIAARATVVVTPNRLGNTHETSLTGQM